jgi:hypothetical protein
MKRTAIKLLEDKTYKEDTQFLDSLLEILLEIQSTFATIYVNFMWRYIGLESGKFSGGPVEKIS